jgi:predicted acetyltransferase
VGIGRPAYRRRGILPEPMHRQLRDYTEAGVPAAILTASEGGRYGYGMACDVCKIAVDRRRATLAPPATRARSNVCRVREPANGCPTFTGAGGRRLRVH